MYPSSALTNTEPQAGSLKQIPPAATGLAAAGGGTGTAYQVCPEALNEP